MAHVTAATGSRPSGIPDASGTYAIGTGTTKVVNPQNRTVGSTTRAPTSTQNPTADCTYTTSMASGALLSSAGITGMQTYCMCGETMAAINMATSASSTISYCAMGEPVPSGYTQVPSENGHIVLSPAQSAAQASASAAAAKCSDGAFVDASCFNELDLPDYLLHWWAANSATCASKNALFAECFYALETKYAPSDCAQLNNDAECTQPVWNDFKNTTNGIQNFYVSWNLWNTAGFFLDMWTAIGAAEGSSQSGLGAIIAQLDPPTNQNVILNDILDALTFGLSLYAEGSILMKALLRSAPQTAGLMGKLFPVGTVNGQYQDWTVISQNVGKCTDAFRASVASGLPLIQNNITSFISWSQNSGLSGTRPALQGLSDSMTQSLNTYAISQIISSLGLVISRAPDTDVHALQTNGSVLNWDTGCSGGYTNGVCDTFFWDGTDTYGITDPNDFTRNFHDDLTSFFTPPGGGGLPLSTGQLLFTGAQNCYTATGKNGGTNPSLDPADATQIQCLSNFQVCTWDESNYGPFDNCPNLPAGNAVLKGFGVSGCIGEADGTTTSPDVPHAYLGPMIYENDNNVASLEVETACDNIPYRRRLRV